MSHLENVDNSKLDTLKLKIKLFKTLSLSVAIFKNQINNMANGDVTSIVYY